jgi:c-di-GMP phosphodiesterase
MQGPGSVAATGHPTVHVGRQPILDVSGRLYGYELLFRDTAEASGATRKGDSATTATILAAFSEFGLNDLLGGRLGFVNLTRAFLVGQLPVPFDPDAAVLEVLETIEIDDAVVAGTRALAAHGYTVALDDFVWTRAAEPLLEVADIVKVDVLGEPWDDVLRTAARSRRHGVRLLAERVEDEEMLARCRDLGFTLFQGYHLGRPQTLSTESLAPGQQLALQLLSRLGDPETTPDDVQELLRRDPALTYRLLRIANGAANGLSQPVASIRDAVVLLGMARLRAWMVLITLAGVGGAADRLAEALTRARTCELLARHTGTVRPDIAFTLGLLDGIAETLGLDAPGLLEGMPPLEKRLAEALAGQPGELRTLLDVVRAYERGEVVESGSRLSHPVLSEAYLASLAWTSRTAGAVTP